jgi:hypothetical protein
MTDAGYRALTRRIIVRRMQRRKAFKESQLEELKLRPLNNIRRRIGKPYYMLATPLFKGTTK